VSGSARLIDFLRNRCPSWIYTTALSPADAAAALAAIEVIEAEPGLLDRLWKNIEYLRGRLGDRGASLKLLPSDAAIICWELPSTALALQASGQLREQGIFAPAIRPPTVPSSRIRLTVTASHQLSDLDCLVDSIRNAHSAIC
jgi:8-amino-7-oxononanoate synthase